MAILIKLLPYIFIFIPILSTILIYQIRFKMVEDNWKAVHTATQLSAVFYIIAVSCLLKVILDSYYIGIILIILISLLAVILIIQWKKHTEVILFKGLKVLSRLCFLFFSISYILLLIYWMIDHFFMNA